jgi:hypothetical protein
MSDGYLVAAGASSIVAIAQAPGNLLELRAELAIDQVASVPEMVVNTSGDRVVTTTETLVVQVVVVNHGNVTSEPTDLSLLLTGLDGGEVPGIQPVPALEPDEPTTVSFDHLPVVPAEIYSLTVRLPLAAGEVESDDNVRTLTFRVNEPTTETSQAG